MTSTIYLKGAIPDPAQIMMTGQLGSSGSLKLLLLAFLMEPST